MPNKSIDNLGKHENDNWNKDELYFHDGIGCNKFNNCFKCPVGKDCTADKKKLLFSNTIMKSSEVII